MTTQNSLGVVCEVQVCQYTVTASLHDHLLHHSDDLEPIFEVPPPHYLFTILYNYVICHIQKSMDFLIMHTPF